MARRWVMNSAVRLCRLAPLLPRFRGRNRGFLAILGWAEVMGWGHAAGYGVYRRVEPHSWSFRVLERSGYGQDLLLVPSEAVGAFAWCLESA